MQNCSFLFKMNEIVAEINQLESLLTSADRVEVVGEDKIDFSKLCRTCLRETSDNDLANDALCIISSNGKLVRIYDMFETATGLKIEATDRLPHHICSACLKLVNASYAFRFQSQRAEETLRNLLRKVKEEVVTVGEEDPEQSVSLDPDEPVSGVVIEDIKPITWEDQGDDLWWTGEEIMEIEQLEEISEPEAHYEVINKRVAEPSSEFSCPFCSSVFYRQRDIIQHYKYEHPKEKPFKCDGCLASFSHIQSMRRHRAIHLADSKKKVCPLCGRLFHRSDDLKRHIRTHTHERPYSCHQCQKAFKQHTELKDHMLTHAERKMYKCILCAKEWRSRNGWYLHVKAHQEGGKPSRRKVPKKQSDEAEVDVDIVVEVDTDTIGGTS